MRCFNIKLVFIFCLLLFLLGNAHAQKDSLTNNITTTKKYRAGFYKNIEEFKLNQPSVIINKKVIVSRQSATLNGGGWYQIETQDTTIHYKRFYKNIWGYCNGEAIFVCDGRIFDNNEYSFSRIGLIGTLSLLECHDPKAIAESTYILKEVAGSLTASGAELIPHGGVIKNAYMIDVIRNLIFPFSVYTLAETLYLHDQKLYEEYRTKSEFERGEQMVDYVTKFNNKIAKKHE